MHQHGITSNQHHHEHVAFGHPLKHFQRRPFKGSDHDHEHYAHQSRHRNLLNNRGQKKHKRQQANGRRDTRCPSSSTRVHVDQRLPDHGTTAHPAKQSANHIGRALTNTLSVSISASFSDFVNQCERHQRFDQANATQDNGERENDPQRAPVQRNHFILQKEQLWQTATDPGSFLC